MVVSTLDFLQCENERKLNDIMKGTIINFSFVIILGISKVRSRKERSSPDI